MPSCAAASRRPPRLRFDVPLYLLNQPLTKFQEAVMHLNAGRYAKGEEMLRTLLRVNPNDASVHNGLGKCFAETGRYDQAIYHVERCLALNPTDRVAAGNLIHMMTLAGRKQDAVKKGEQLLPRFAREPNVVLSLATAYVAITDYERAEYLLKKFNNEVGVAPNLVSYLGAVLLNLGRAPESEQTLRLLLKHVPGDGMATGLLASALNYLPNADRRECFELHRAFGRSLENGKPVVDPLSFANDPNPDRQIRVAIISPDFREHPVARFADAILRHHDRERIHLAGFYLFPTDDRVTKELQPLCASWRSIRTSKPDIIADWIKKENIDVVVEICGLTSNSPLFALAPRIAPVQVSAVGYPHTTGMSTIDARFVDSFTDPVGDADQFATEKLIRLDPCFLCYTPLHKRRPGPSPVAKNGFITFGSFNKITKFSDAAFELWGRIMQRVPSARLLVKTAALDGVSAKKDVSARLARVGITPDRFELVGLQKESIDHLGMYDRVDIALDTFPYNGTTTTCESLYMGVPVVALEGKPHAARVCVSLLHAVGHTELLAKTGDEYVDIAVRLASDPAALAPLRERLHDDLLASPLCDAKSYAARWSGAVRDLWRDWCTRKAAATRV
jgi:protein O-GlcNAc transferase